MPPTDHVTQLVEAINKRANDILYSGGGEKDLIVSLCDVMDKIKQVMDASTKDELNGYYQKYRGFCRYINLLRTLTQGVSDGTIKKP